MKKLFSIIALCLVGTATNAQACAIGGKNIQVTGFTNIKNEQLTLLLI